MTKPRLLPVGVPWMITPSTPFLRLCPIEGGAHDTVQAVFVGFFGLNSRVIGKLPTEEHPEIAEPPGDFEPAKEPGDAPYRHVRINFWKVVDSWSLRVLDDSGVDSEFDWSIAREHEQGERDWHKIQRKFWENWRRTGICPDPLMYELDPPLGLSPVDNDQELPLDIVRHERIVDLRKRYSNAGGLHHYLLLGHDENVEVVGHRWSWEEGKAVTGW